MKLLKICLMGLTLSFTCWAGTINKTISSNNYKEARAKLEYLKFTGSSTKFGFVTTSFDGYAKKIEVVYELDEKQTQVKSFVITIPNNSFDTDDSSRDSKLSSVCLEEEKFKNTRAELKEPINLTEINEGKTTILFTPKDVTLPINLVYSMVKTPEGFKLNLKSHFSFKAVNIVDPSIAIAKVAEEFQIEGSILISAGNK
jgi:polyisoprenoid-binding protein YceI